MATQLPDLVVYAITLPTTSIKLGEYLQFSMVIANIGTADSGVVTWPGIYLDSTSTANAAAVFFGIRTISNVAPNQSFTYDYTLNTSSLSVGTHTLYLNPDDNNWVFESNETNNWKSVQFSVTPLQVNHAPVVTGKAVSVGVGQAIALSSLFSVTDFDGDSIATYEFYDPLGVGSLHWDNAAVTWNPTDRTLIVPASSLSVVTLAGDFVGSEVMRVAASDGLNWGAWSNASVTVRPIDTIAPAVLSFNPADEATGVSVASNITLTFTEPIKLGTGMIWLKTASGLIAETYNNGQSPANFSIVGSTLTIVPFAPLAFSTGYKVEFAAGSILDSANNSYAGTTSYNFTTAQASVSTKAASDIFKAEGAGFGNVGLIRVMADFSKAAYTLRSWENPAINDYKPYSQDALDDIEGRQGWTPVQGLSPAMPATTIMAGTIVVHNRMVDGFFVNGNASAFVARSADALVISFRGTNDNGQNYSPDERDWIPKSTHYDLLRPLVAEINKYVQNNGIKNVYATGHSLGGAMALKFMTDHLEGTNGASYSAVTFAAPTYDILNYDLRMKMVEIEGDLTPDLTLFKNGTTVHFVGNGLTLPINDLLGANHSMDYYRQMVDSVDPQSLQIIFGESGSKKVLIGAQRIAYSDDIVVDGRRSGTNTSFDPGNDQLIDPVGADFDVFYGGKGNDTFIGGSGKETMIGGPGDDTIDGGDGLDTAVFSGVLANYSISKNATAWTVFDNTGKDGTDTLKNVERLKFSDAVKALDVSPTQSSGMTQLLLGAVLGKDLLATKKPLIGDVVRLFDSGLYTMQVLSGALMRLDIWGLLANGGQPGATNTQIASYLFTTVNKATPDPVTLAAAVMALNTETSTAQGNFLWHLAESPANQAQVGLVGLAATGLEFGG